MTELSMSDLEKISGGVIVDDGSDKLWLVRQDGSIIGPAPRDKATSFAKSFSTSTEILTTNDYEKRFGRSFKW